MSRHRLSLMASSSLADWTCIASTLGDPVPTKHVQSDLDSSMRDLVSIDVFAKLLNDPVGRDRFREWLVKSASNPSSIDSLDFYNDSQAYRKFLDEFMHVGLSLHGASPLCVLGSTAYADPTCSSFLVWKTETFLSEGARRPVSHLTGSSEAESSSAALRKQKSHIETSPFAAAAEKALEDLYRNEFGPFIRTKVVRLASHLSCAAESERPSLTLGTGMFDLQVEQARVRLGLFANPAERGDLGDGQSFSCRQDR